MLKIFRTIRQRLLSENKFTRYLLYAIGEIILVVIGILIALSINNANDQSKRCKKELTLLTEMSQNLRTDLDDLEYNITGNTQRIRSNQIILKHLQERIPMHDSLRAHYGRLFGNYQLSENTAAWATLQSVGLDLISDDSLRNAISQLYTVRYEYLENVEKGVDDRFQWDQIYPQFLETLDWNEVWVTATPVDHNALMDDRKFQETIKMNLFIRNFMQGRYTITQRDVHSLLDRLERHMHTLNASI